MFKKVVLIISVVLTGVGLFMAILGNSGESVYTSGWNVIDVFDEQSVYDGAAGIITCDPSMDLFPVSDDMCVYLAYNEEGESFYMPVVGYGVQEVSTFGTIGLQDDQGNLIVPVMIHKITEEHREEAVEAIWQYQIYLYGIVSEDPGDVDEEFLEYCRFSASEEGRIYIAESISEYECEYLKTPPYALIGLAGTILAVIAGIVMTVTLLSYKFKPKTIVIGSVVLILTGTTVFLISSYRRIATMSSVDKAGEGLYLVRYTDDYKLDKMLGSGIASETAALSWASDNLYYGLPLDNMLNGSFGCSAIAVQTPEGDHLMGRNYDFPATDSMLIYTDPDDGYASIGMADLDVLGMGSGEDSISPTSFTGRAFSLSLPYMTVDGVNEAGLGISILQLDEDEIHQDKGRTDITMFVAIRAILDRCAGIDEAVAFLDSYDMHSMIDSSFHLFITDRSGRSVVIEWLSNEMIITDSPEVTNFVVGDPDHYIDYPDLGSDGRDERLIEDLGACDGIATEEEAMAIMSHVAVLPYEEWGWTQWTCVYNLDDFTVDVCVDTDYDQTYHITPETFGVRR